MIQRGLRKEKYKQDTKHMDKEGYSTKTNIDLNRAHINDYVYAQTEDQ